MKHPAAFPRPAPPRPAPPRPAPPRPAPPRYASWPQLVRLVIDLGVDVIATSHEIIVAASEPIA